jgi:hypothetical protein
MPRNRDLRLHDFYPLDHPFSFGQSIKETDLTPVHSDAPVPGFFVFNDDDIIQCSYHKGFGSALSGEAWSSVCTVEIVGERHV